MNSLRAVLGACLGLFVNEAVLLEEYSGGDPYNLRRFTAQQAQYHQIALEEIRAGRKVSHWSWYCIPTPPYVMNGVERGSPINQKFAIRSHDEARSYLQFSFDGVDLRANYVELMSAVREQLALPKCGGVVALLGSLDAPKLVASLQLFKEVANEVKDDQLRELCEHVLDLAQS